MINKQILNAANLLKELKANPGMKLTDYCVDNELSKHFLEQIGRKLVHAKLILSRRGPGGGYTLNREKVTLAELVLVFKTVNSKEPLIKKAMTALAEINVLDK
jgi:DNA-binding IscR family transcriptional regulator